MVKKDDDEVARSLLEGIGIVPEKQEIREQQNIYQASELGKIFNLNIYFLFGNVKVRGLTFFIK